MPGKRSNRQTSKDSFENQILGVFQKHPTTPYNYKQVAKALNVDDSSTKGLIKIILKELCNEREIEQLSVGKYKLNPANIKYDKRSGGNDQFVIGKVDMKSTGNAYVICDDLEEDVFIHTNHTNHALQGDEVKVSLFKRGKDKKPEGQIVEILSRSKTRFVGIIQKSAKFAFLVSGSPSMPVDIFIPLASLNGAEDGEKALAEITDWPQDSKNPFGKIIEVLGMPGEHETEMQSILAEHDFPLRFPDQVEAEANKIPLEIPEAEIKRRRDFRDILTLTIDPFNAKDFDDALSIRKLGEGRWEIGVHIADVSHYIVPNSALDQEALTRATSIYLVDRVIPMLPERLSNGVCSLRPHEEKLCFSAVFELNEEAEILHEWFGKTIINSDHRFTYEEVQDILMQPEAESEYKSELLLFHSLAQKLRTKRMSNGAINFRSSEVAFELDENGKPLRVIPKENNESHQLIEDFMLLANRKVTEFVDKLKEQNKVKAFVYRVHEQPIEDKLNSFKQFISKIGYQLELGSRKTTANSLNKLLTDISGTPEEYMISEIAVRTMEKAYYSTKNLGHYGLAFEHYTHFTSPIRRYPDLMVHRLLHQYLQENYIANPAEYETKCKHCSERERNASQAERESIKYKQVEFLEDKIGQTFEGIISGVSRWGIFVKIIENHCEGMITIKDMTDDFYQLDEENYRVVGNRNKKVYKLGDTVNIRVKKANLAKKQLDFIFADEF